MRSACRAVDFTAVEGEIEVGRPNCFTCSDDETAGVDADRFSPHALSLVRPQRPAEGDTNARLILIALKQDILAPQQS
ncbi:unnamed protein product [Urochloa humidicola]